MTRNRAERLIIDILFIKTVTHLIVLAFVLKVISHNQDHCFNNFQVHALYDFDGQPGSGELSISCGEVLTLVRTDVGEGWWEGTNSKGESGLFPEAYVQVIDCVKILLFIVSYSKGLHNRKILCVSL